MLKVGDRVKINISKEHLDPEDIKEFSKFFGAGYLEEIKESIGVITYIGNLPWDKYPIVVSVETENGPYKFCCSPDELSKEEL